MSWDNYSIERELGHVTICCEGNWPSSLYGSAITEVTIDNRTGQMWVGNGEYESQVNYCPICGNKASTGVKE